MLQRVSRVSQELATRLKEAQCSRKSATEVIQMVVIDEATQTPAPKELAVQPGRQVITKL